MAITYLGNAEGVSAHIKRSCHQSSLNNLMKIDSLEFKLYFDGVFIFFFFILAIFTKYFPSASLSPQKEVDFDGVFIFFFFYSRHLH